MGSKLVLYDFWVNFFFVLGFVFLDFLLEGGDTFSMRKFLFVFSSLAIVLVLSGCASSSDRTGRRSLVTKRTPLLVGPISDGIFQTYLSRAQYGDLTAIDIVISYYFNNDMVPEATYWQQRREVVVANKGPWKGKWRGYRP